MSVAVLGDTISYTVNIANNAETTSARNVVLTDYLPDGLAFVEESVKVDGLPRPSGDIMRGIPLGSVNVNGSVTVTYQAAVTSIPAHFSLSNTASAAFTYQSPNNGNPIAAVVPSNTVTTTVNAPVITVHQSANHTTAVTGNTVTYTMLVANTGNVAAEVELTDLLPAGSAYVAGSFRVNDVAVPSANPSVGVSLGIVLPNTTTTVTFSVLVSSLPSPPQLVNQAVVSYTFSPSEGRIISGVAASNVLTLPVSLPSVSAVIQASLADVAVGETLTYTTVITNNQTVPLMGVLLTGILPQGTQFIAGSVTLNGTALPSANLSSGIPAGTISIGATAVVSLQVKVLTLPASGKLVHQSSIAYQAGSSDGMLTSNTVVTPVYQPDITVVKSAGSKSVVLGNTLLYTLDVRNTGNLAAAVTLTDVLPQGAAFVANSVTVNGSARPGDNPATGIAIGSLAPEGSAIITYQIRAQSFPASANLTNIATYSYVTSLPSGRALNGSGASNAVTTAVAPSNIAVLLSSNRTFVTIGDVLTYTVLVANNGNSAVTNGHLIGLIPTGAALVSNSVTVNGTLSPSANPAAGISIPTIIRNTTVTVTYQVRIVSLPPSGSLDHTASFTFNNGNNAGTSYSNPVVTTVIGTDIQISNQASVTQTTIGNTFSYAYLINNSGNVDVSLTLTVQVPQGAIFLENSVLIDDEPVPGIAPATGILVMIPAGGSALVSFVVAVETVPASQLLVNQAVATYFYSLPDGETVSGTTTSNTETVTVTLPEVALVKQVNQVSAVTGDILVFTNVLTNNGTSSIHNVVLYDPLASNLAFIPGSVRIDGMNRPTASPASGITLGTIADGVSVTVSFEVNVTMAVPSNIKNQSTASFTSGSFSATTASNTTVTPVTQPQISLVKSALTSAASVGGTVAYTLVVSNSGNLAANVTLTDTIPSGTAFTDNSVIVNGSTLPGASPITGIEIGSLAPGATAVVTFSVLVTSLPIPQFLVNTATADFTYSPPDGRTLTGMALSNAVSIPVSAPDVSVSLSTSSTSLTIGDTIVYSSIVTNNGIELVNDVVYMSSLPNGSIFVGGSVTINGIPAPGENPATGITLGSIAPSASVTVSFRNQVAMMPPASRLDIVASVTFTSGAFSGTALSNLITTPVFQPVLSAIKSASTTSATVGDTVTYTVQVANNGNYAALLTVTDPIPDGSAFVPNSVLLNSSPSPGSDPVTGINAGLLNPGQSTTIQFSVIIESLPNPQRLSNQAVAGYTFTLPDGRTFSRTAASNSVIFPVSAPNVSAVKEASLSFAAVGETITYTTIISNNGIAAINNVLLLDIIPSETTFTAGTVTVDGSSRPLDNPAIGIVIGTIAPGTAVTVGFQVLVAALPDPAVMSNQSSVTFTSGTFSGSAFSNTVVTQVYQPILTTVKSGSTSNASVGSNLTYTITLTNSGNYGAAVTLTDVIPEGTSFLPNSVIVNGQPLPGADPSTGISLGVVTTSASASFTVTVQSLPASQLLTNQASTSYSFTLPDNRTLSGSTQSNILTIPVSAPHASVVKSTPRSDAVIGDIIPYTVTVTNTGIANITNVIVSDPVPVGAILVSGSVTVDGVHRPSAVPANGIALGTIEPGSSVTIQYQLTVVSLPGPPQLSNRAAASFTSGTFSGTALSNIVTVPVYQPIISLVKNANATQATVGDTITYSIYVTNNGNWPAAVTLTDAIPPGAVFIANSVIINGVPQPGVNPAEGITLGTIAPGDTISILVTLEVRVDSLPLSQQLVNQAAASFTFTPPDGRELTGTTESNSLVIPVSSPEVSVVKSTNAIDAVIGDRITYTIVVTNNGISPVNHVVLVDPDSPGSRFVEGSVSIDGSPRPELLPSSGIPIGTLSPGASRAASFQVEVVPVETSV